MPILALKYFIMKQDQVTLGQTVRFRVMDEIHAGIIAEIGDGEVLIEKHSVVLNIVNYEWIKVDDLVDAIEMNNGE